VKRRWEIPQGLHVFPDGSWRVGGLHVIHPPSLRHFKSHLVHEADGDFIVDGAQRLRVQVAGPAFQAVSLILEPEPGRARVALDDGSVEPVEDRSLGMNRESGRFECIVRGGAFTALLTRGAHQVLLEHLEEDGGRFFLRVGQRRIPVRT
jgi:hypothetical protein